GRRRQPRPGRLGRPSRPAVQALAPPGPPCQWWARPPPRPRTCRFPPCTRSSARSRRFGRRRRQKPRRASGPGPPPARTRRACAAVRSRLRGGGLLGSVDLGALRVAGIVDVDRLPLREHVERGLARLAVAVAGVLRATEREVNLGADRAGGDG